MQQAERRDSIIEAGAGAGKNDETTGPMIDFVLRGPMHGLDDEILQVEKQAGAVFFVWLGVDNLLGRVNTDPFMEKALAAIAALSWDVHERLEEVSKRLVKHHEDAISGLNLARQA